jgi:hypothetical protein
MSPRVHLVDVTKCARVIFSNFGARNRAFAEATDLKPSRSASVTLEARQSITPIAAKSR